MPMRIMRRSSPNQLLHMAKHDADKDGESTSPKKVDSSSSTTSTAVTKAVGGTPRRSISLFKRIFLHPSLKPAPAVRPPKNLLADACDPFSVTFTSWFGPMPFVYCDWVASGRALGLVEQEIQSRILPFYGNTHTIADFSGAQTGQFREDARTYIGECCHADGDKDSVLFCGQGVTGCLLKLLNTLKLRDVQPENVVVFVGPYEHNSNLLPWRESGFKVVAIPDSASGFGLDQSLLKQALEQYKESDLLVGSFSACSNVTGVLERVDDISSMMHEYPNGLVFWDYASAGPYVDMDMNPKDRPLAYKDAMCISTHKFLGGPGGAGVLVAKKHLFQDARPEAPGGGTVFWVGQDEHKYTENLLEREEAGTPNILACIRAGYAFKVKHELSGGLDKIHAREQEILARVEAKLSSKITVLGPKASGDDPEQRRLPTFSFLVQGNHQQRYLHPNLVSAVLNDLFGIQTRSGCFCASVYLYPLLGMDLDTTSQFLNHSSGFEEMVRPMATRLSFPYFCQDDMIDYVCEALNLVAEYGHGLVPLYQVDRASALWYRGQPASEQVDHLFGATTSSSKPTKKTTDVATYAGLLKQAQRFMQEQVQRLSKVDYQEEDALENHPLRWYVSKKEASGGTVQKNNVEVMDPSRYQNGSRVELVKLFKSRLG